MDQGYEKECAELLAKTKKCGHEISAQYREEMLKSYGLDGAPWEKAFGELTKSFSTELKALKKKYGIEDHHGER